MKATCFLIVFMAFALAWTAGDLIYRGNAVHKDYPGQCYYNELQQPIPKQQTYKPINRNRCESIYCRADYVLEIEFCGRHNLVPSDKCRIVADQNVAYPQCCPKLMCSGDDDNENLIR